MRDPSKLDMRAAVGFRFLTGLRHNDRQRCMKRRHIGVAPGSGYEAAGQQVTAASQALARYIEMSAGTPQISMPSRLISSMSERGSS